MCTDTSAEDGGGRGGGGRKKTKKNGGKAFVGVGWKEGIVMVSV